MMKRRSLYLHHALVKQLVGHVVHILRSCVDADLCLSQRGSNVRLILHSPAPTPQATAILSVVLLLQHHTMHTHTHTHTEICMTWQDAMVLRIA